MKELKFEDVAPFIWGGIPIDKDWAITTLVYKQYLKQFLNTEVKTIK